MAKIPLTFSGNEVTDATRIANVDGDGRPPEGSTGIWVARTNQCPNGGFEEGIDGWTEAGPGSSMYHNTSYAKFGEGSLSFFATTIDSGVEITFSAVTSTSAHRTVGFWLHKISGASGKITANVIVSGGANPPANIGTTECELSQEDEWEYFNVFAQNDSATGRDSLTLQFLSDTAGDENVFSIDGVMINLPAYRFAWPYVESFVSPGGVVVPPEGILSEDGFWVAYRYRNGQNISGSSFLIGTTPDILFTAENINNLGDITLYSRAGGTFVTSAMPSPGISTTICSWNPDEFGLSVNGSPFSTNTSNPCSIDSFTIGNALNIYYGNKDYFWFAAGIGELTDDDASTIAGFGNTPALEDFPGDPTFLWLGGDTEAFVPDPPTPPSPDKLILLGSDFWRNVRSR